MQESDDRGNAKLEALAQQILDELRRQSRFSGADFSVTKLLAYVVQCLVVFALFYAYLHRAEGTTEPLLLAIFLETLTIALLMMGQHK